MSTGIRLPPADRFVAVCSSGGSVLRSALATDGFRRRLAAVVVDRACIAEALADEWNLPVQRIDVSDNIAFSDRLDAYMDEVGATGVVCFFTRLLAGGLLRRNDRILLNFHPSLLPAFQGFHAFDRSWDSGNPLIGSTVHLIDDSVDNGPVLIQSLIVRDSHLTREEARHQLFLQQVRLLIQVTSWCAEGRLLLDGRRLRVAGADYAAGPFIPALDDAEARQLPD